MKQYLISEEELIKIISTCSIGWQSSVSDDKLENYLKSKKPVVVIAEGEYHSVIYDYNSINSVMIILKDKSIYLEYKEDEPKRGKKVEIILKEEEND